MTEKTGILFAGHAGAIASTVIAGANLLKQGFSPKYALLCESYITEDQKTIADKLELPQLEDLVFSGWDIYCHTIEESLRHHKVLSENDIVKVSVDILNQPALPVPCAVNKGEWGQEIEGIRSDIRNFRKKNQLNYVVVVNCISTQPTPKWSETYDSLDKFQESCYQGYDTVTPSMKYACAAVLESAGYINFTPNLSAVPAIVTLAKEKGVPLAGRDGKTGQTFLKTVLASALNMRQLYINGWYSTNILGNRDGEALSEEDAFQTKLMSKLACLDEIVGYKVEDHQVHIHHYRPRGDNKESWDNIDLQGFLGYSMQIKINGLYRDSILAAPLILDMVRLMTISIKIQEGGLTEHLAAFFKSPEMPEGTNVIHDFFAQYSLLQKWIYKHIKN
ncbi:inositol-3-phosphate synthase [Argonema galeatum]|uniref:inositol-3-phosphate synthase n=1 Tax=Argonema galeatum TaxID=2942762 RepID=UPI002010E562|nr:inositol-3-phosphate synthase [Argonema galeatum]MCL1463052.1 inositol-3-phosphate synthase [Argonema galeatum A003/A1]